MSKKVTVINGVVDAVYLCEPPKNVEAIGALDEVFPGWLYDGENFAAPIDPDPTLEDLRSQTLAEIATKASDLLSVGAPVSDGLHIALDDGSRADLTAMAATATAAASGAVSWPDSYARGWIAIENVRIPLATPAAGLALAASVGNYYAAIVQHRRDLKDAALAAVDAAALDAIDITAGWPT
jgi:hypothetical protein